MFIECLGILFTESDNSDRLNENRTRVRRLQLYAEIGVLATRRTKGKSMNA